MADFMPLLLVDTFKFRSASSHGQPSPQLLNSCYQDRVWYIVRMILWSIFEHRQCRMWGKWDYLCV